MAKRRSQTVKPSSPQSRENSNAIRWLKRFEHQLQASVEPLGRIFHLLEQLMLTIALGAIALLGIAVISAAMVSQHFETAPGFQVPGMRHPRQSEENQVGKGTPCRPLQKHDQDGEPHDSSLQPHEVRLPGVDDPSAGQP